MTIVEFTGTGSIGGAQVYALQLSEFLRERGHRVIFIARGETPPTPLEIEVKRRGLEAQFWPLPARKGKRDIRNFLRLGLFLRRENVDVLHTHLNYGNYLGGLTGRVWGVPVVAHAHATDSLKPYRFSPQIIACADAVKNHLVGQGMSASRIQTIYNGVQVRDLEQVSPALRQAAREKLNLPPEAPVVGVVANLRERKGHRFLLEAMAQLARELPSNRVANYHALFAGEGDQLEPLRAQAKTLGIENRVHFLGFTPDVASVLYASDVFALPSAKEGLSIAVTEAMVRGIPVVSTDVSGLPEVVRQGQTGRLIPPENAPALAAALRDCLDLPDKTAEMARAARLLMETEFEETHCLAQCEQFLISQAKSSRNQGGAREKEWVDAG